MSITEPPISQLRGKYPPIEPRSKAFLQVDAEHSVYWEESGNPEGKPVLFVHGGPGGGCDEGHRSYFDPSKYRIILFDQRGAGRSTPHASINNNSTWHLVSDMERLREHLGIEKWMLFGGSWGSTLSLCYAIKHSQRVTELILRGIFLCRPEELEWFYQEGAHQIFPDRFEQYRDFIPSEERTDFISAYYKRLCSEDEKLRLEACKCWAGWEASALFLRPDPEAFAAFTIDAKAVSLARIECHFFVNQAFFESPNWILENVSALAKIPTHIVHGRYDVVCPVKNAWDLFKAMPHSSLEIIADAGHAASEPGICDALIRATDRAAAGSL